MNQQFRNITYLSDTGGTGAWRCIWPSNSINCIRQGTEIQMDYSQTPILDARWYGGITSITIQRWISPQQRELVDKLFKPICEQQKAWLIYEIDDLMSDKFIPQFNRGKKAFEGEKVQGDIKHMLNQSDIVKVTTDYIKECYHKYYDVPMEKIVALPNLLPRYLFGDRYDPNKSVELFRKMKNKPRIGIVSSLSHYNIDNVRTTSDGKACRPNTVKDENGNQITKWISEDNIEIQESETHVIEDDMDIIIDMIRETVNDFQWVFFGYAPPKLQDLIKDKKIEIHGGVPIMNYPSQFSNLGLQAVIAPIQDIEFNRCKSFIKYMECAALGVPLFASNALPYNRVMPRNQLFDNGKELKEKLMNLKFSSAGAYQKIVENQWKWFHTPCHEGNFDLKNYWLEDNLNIYVDLYRLRQKCTNASLDVYMKIKQENAIKQTEQTIFSDNNGVEILK